MESNICENWDEANLTSSCKDTKANKEVDFSCVCQRLRKQNEYLRERYISVLSTYRDLLSERSEEQFGDYLSAMPDNALHITMSNLSLTDLFSVRCVSRKLRNWAEFEMKSRKKLFMVTKKHKCDYEIFLHFKLFPNISTLVIDSLSPSVQLINLLRLCKDFLPHLEKIVIEGYEQYMVIIGVYPKTEKYVPSSHLAQEVLSKEKAHDESCNMNYSSVYYLHGLKNASNCVECDRVDNSRHKQFLSQGSIEYYWKQNTFLKDKTELLEKECQRIKSDENLSLFTILPEEVTLKILQHLSIEDYFQMRLVSKELKHLAEMALKSRKQTLYVSLSTDSAYRIYLWSKIYSNIKTLTISGSDLSLEVILRLCGNNFPNLVNLTICSSDTHNVELIGDYFTTLKSLTLRYNDYVGEGIPSLLSKLCCLESLTVNGSLKTDSKSSDLNSLFFVGNAAHLETFTYECFEYLPFDLKLVSETLKKELPNLKGLHLNLPSITVYDFCQLFLCNIEELELCCCRIDGNLTLSNEARNVKKLILSTESNSDVEIASILQNFPNLNTLQLDLFRNHDISFSSHIVEALRSLKSLKFFFLFDAFYAKSKYFTLDDGNKSALIEVLSSLNNVSRFKVEFSQQSYEDEDLLTAVNALVNKKPHQFFELIIPDNEFDLYESFSEASINSWDSYVDSCSEYYDTDYDFD